MAYDQGELKASLAAAVGEDPALLAELRIAYRDGVRRHVQSLATARGAESWRSAAWRLHGLAASFCAQDMMRLAERAANGPCGSPAMLRDIEVLISAQ